MAFLASALTSAVTGCVKENDGTDPLDPLLVPKNLKITFLKRLNGEWSKPFRHIFQDTRGVVSLEVALLLPTVVLMLFFTLDLGVQLMTQITLDSSTRSAGRQLQINAASRTTADQVRASICQTLGVLMLHASCSNIQVYATSSNTFGNLTTAHVSGQILTPSTYNAGSPRSFTLLQVAFYDPAVAFLPGFSSPTLLSSVSFVNEP